LVTAVTVTGWPRIGPSTLWPNVQNVPRIEPADAAAAGANRVYFDLGRAICVCTDALLVRHRDLQAFNQADVGTGPAHVIGDEILDADVRP